MFDGIIDIVRGQLYSSVADADAAWDSVIADEHRAIGCDEVEMGAAARKSFQVVWLSRHCRRSLVLPTPGSK
ncbi:MAG TPA: hypothetical protein PKN47_14980 [Nitrospira sp.]|nr:hypothetical protein [Nitrospira sp.]